jgi:hypothetical protein
MVDSIGSTTSVSSQRLQQAQQTQSLRQPQTLNAVQTREQRSSSATNPVKTFQVPQTSKNVGPQARTTPRGSIVDVLA